MPMSHSSPNESQMNADEEGKKRKMRKLATVTANQPLGLRKERQTMRRFGASTTRDVYKAQLLHFPFIRTSSYVAI